MVTTDSNVNFNELNRRSVPRLNNGKLTEDFIIPHHNKTYLSQLDKDTWTDINDIDINNLKASGCSAVAATIAARIMEKKPYISTKDLYDWGVWGKRGNNPWAMWTQNGKSRLTFTYSHSNGNYDMAKKDIFDDICKKRPVIILLKGDNGSTHYVVGYGLTAGASKNNLQPNQIIVYNPYKTDRIEGSQTLQYMMNASPLWRKFGSVRRVIPK